MASADTPYRGRFAPSPTGPLHLGSLIAALASYLDARSAGGVWLVRMEDLDPPREAPGAADSILNSLQRHGLYWDEDVLFQSTRAAYYDAALQQLMDQGALFACNCTRAEMGAGSSCCGRCQQREADTASPYALRVAVAADRSVAFDDLLQGPQLSNCAAALSDFVVRRKDNLYAYQLAVVVDDHAQGITDIVRGSDLLDSTPRQIYLQQLLHYPTPAYLHIPVIANAQGQKLSKQNHAPPLEDADACANLRRALQFLGQPAPAADMQHPGEILAYATAHWSRLSLPAVMARTAAEAGLLYPPGTPA